MKKLIALMLLICTFTFLLSSCGGNKKVTIEKPEDTSLERWLFEKPDTENWTEIESNYWERSYLAPGYELVVGDQGYKENCVIYGTARFPLYELGVHKIIGIYISDPEVTLWGLTMNSTHEQSMEVMTKLGFVEVIYQKDLGRSLYENGKFRLEIIEGKFMKIFYYPTSIINEIAIRVWG